MSEFNYKDEVAKIVCSLENERNKILTQQKLISSIDFDTYKPTVRQWQKLMLINEVRCNSKLTSKLISNIFPEAKDISLRPNYIHFKLNDFNCMISTSAIKEAHIYGRYEKDYNCFNNLTKEQCQNFLETIYKLKAFHNGEVSFLNIDDKKHHRTIKDYVISEDEVISKVKYTLRILEENDKNIEEDIEK